MRFIISLLSLSLCLVAWGGERDSIVPKIESLVKKHYYFYAIKDREIIFINGASGQYIFISKHELITGPNIFTKRNDFSLKKLTYQILDLKKEKFSLIVKKDNVFYKLEDKTGKPLNLEKDFPELNETK